MDPIFLILALAGAGFVGWTMLKQLGVGGKPDCGCGSCGNKRKGCG